MNSAWIARFTVQCCPLGVGALLVIMLAGCAETIPDKNLKLSRTHYLLGEDFLKNKKPLQAKRELQKAISLDPNNRQAYVMLGFVAFYEGMHNLNHIDRARCTKGEEADDLRKNAEQEFERAKGFLKQSVKLAEEQEKTESEGLLLLANIAIHFKQYRQALKLVKQALKNNFYPRRHLLHSVAGWAHFHLGDYRNAGKELRQAIFHEPKFCLGRYRLAKVHFARKQYDNAITELKQVVDKNCPIQEGPYLLGRAYAQKRSMDQAHRQFQRCAKMYVRSCLSAVCLRLAKDAARGPEH